MNAASGPRRTPLLAAAQIESAAKTILPEALRLFVSRNWGRSLSLVGIAKDTSNADAEGGALERLRALPRPLNWARD